MLRIIFCLSAIIATGTFLFMGNDHSSLADEPVIAQQPASLGEDDSVAARKPGELPVPKIDPAILKSWIKQLDDDDFNIREEATRRLIAADAQVIPIIVKEAAHAGPEGAVRIVHILEQIYVHGSGDVTVDEAEGALESLKSSKYRTLSNRADLALQANYNVRERRAIQEIIRLGGTVNYNNQRVLNPNGFQDVSREIAYIVITPRWSGGDEGLKHIKRLTHLLHLYYIRGAKVSPEALEALQKAMPQVSIQTRSPAYLGIAGGPHPRGCQIAQIKEGTAADTAGLNIGDVITHFDGKPVKDFDALIEEIAKKQPGDEVEMTVLRIDQSDKVIVELGEWQ